MPGQRVKKGESQKPQDRAPGRHIPAPKKAACVQCRLIQCPEKDAETQTDHAAEVELPRQAPRLLSNWLRRRRFASRLPHSDEKASDRQPDSSQSQDPAGGPE